MIYESPKLSVWILQTKHFFKIALMNKQTQVTVFNQKKNKKMLQPQASLTLKPNHKCDAGLK